MVALKQTPTGWTYGLLWNHIWSIAGSSNRADVNSTFLQPFLAKAMGKGLTLNANFESTYDWEGHNWVVPMNLSVSQVMKLGTQLVSISGGLGRARPPTQVRASTISASPARKLPNMAASNVEVPAGAVRNSFQINTPQNAATMVAPWPSP